MATSAAGAPRRLDPILYWLASVDASGAIWTALTGSRAGVQQTYEVRISPADGSPARPLSPGLPLDLSADRAVPDGAGGHLLSGLEVFSDSTTHRTVFAVAADGTSTRLGCDPSPDLPYIQSAAVAPDAVYLAVNYSNSGWTVVKVPRR